MPWVNLTWIHHWEYPWGDKNVDFWNGYEMGGVFTLFTHFYHLYSCGDFIDKVQTKCLQLKWQCKKAASSGTMPQIRYWQLFNLKRSPQIIRGMDCPPTNYSLWKEKALKIESSKLSILRRAINNSSPMELAKYRFSKVKNEQLNFVGMKNISPIAINKASRKSWWKTL